MLGSQVQTHPKDGARASQGEKKGKARYFLVWRWHFYAGLFVIPFMLMLSVTGLVMLFDDEIEELRYGALINIEPQSTQVAVSTQLEAVQKAYPSAVITQLIVTGSKEQANRFNVRLENGKSLFVTVNPYDAEVLGEIDRSDSWYQLANEIHGTLLIGQWGDYLIEVSASLGILLLVSGIYLWIPRDSATKVGFLRIRTNSGTRTLIKDIHTNLGGTLSVILLLFLLSGLAWAGVWGAKMVQGWNTFPTYYTWGDKPQSTQLHKHLNHGSEEEMPWNLELAAVPESSGHHGGHQTENDLTQYHSDDSISVDAIALKAEQLGLTQYRIYLPQSETGVYTIAANSMAGDVIDPRLDRTVHVDQYSGQTLIDVTWDDYTVVAKLMAAGVSLHQGDLSPVNKWLNVFFCIAFIAISVTGAWMWWIRRPVKQSRLGVPPRFELDGIWKVGLGSLLLVGVLFPLAGVTIIVAMLFDTLLIQKSQRLKAYMR
ncbi:PepSY-associated TM helix domain-containing protein [Vibrio sp. TBV020]|uniref:PepSY-associated TM helix domain-containing protein n=1 Tax=Vibrio sp. TBV020 TaxID=3137398 RepID=UPI0038CD9629